MYLVNICPTNMKLQLEWKNILNLFIKTANSEGEKMLIVMF